MDQRGDIFPETGGTKLAIVVTFHFARERLTYLRRISKEFTNLGNSVKMPGVNYIGGWRQLLRRVGAPHPLPWQGVGLAGVRVRLAGN